MKLKITTASILTIGDEILYGQITDTNSQWIGQELSVLGILLTTKLSVGDKFEEIIKGLDYCKKNSDFVIITGGLGPTKDDITKNVLCDYFKTGLKRNEIVLKHVKDFFEKRGKEFTLINQAQADVLENSQVLFNEMGTAPGMWIQDKNTIFVCMPGVPYEMKHIFSTKIIPKLKSEFDLLNIIHQFVMTIGIGESFLADLISEWENNLPKFIRLAYLPSPGIVKLRLSANGNDIELLKLELKKQISSLIPYIEKYIFSLQNITIEESIAKALVNNKLNISISESCTGGALSSAFTNIAGSSAYFMGSFVAYSNEIKQNIININKDTILKYGAVSEETVLEMAINTAKIFKTDLSLATSGIAGPDGGTIDKPVGTVWIACYFKGKTHTKKLTLTQNRELNIRLSVVYSLNLLKEVLFIEANQKLYYF